MGASDSVSLSSSDVSVALVQLVVVLVTVLQSCKARVWMMCALLVTYHMLSAIRDDVIGFFSGSGSNGRG